MFNNYYFIIWIKCSANFKISRHRRTGITYNYRIIWRVLDVVAAQLTCHKFTLGEARLISIKNEFNRPGLSISSHYKADGIMFNKIFDLEVLILATSGPFGNYIPRNTSRQRMDYY